MTAGRPNKLTSDVKAALIGAIGQVAHRSTAAAIAGIDQKTLRRWLHQGQAEDAKEPFISFAMDFLKAEAEVEMRLTRTVVQASDRDWHAGAWALERFAGKNWNLKTQIEHSGPEGGPIKVTPAAAAAAVREEFGSHAAVKSESERDDNDEENERGSD